MKSTAGRKRLIPAVFKHHGGTPADRMDLNEYRRKSVAVVYRDIKLFPLLTALENIMYTMQLCK
jgi:ABC-type proline/glycine betaine transport system ATPase subunit